MAADLMRRAVDGYPTYADLTRATAEELPAIHGGGPKAIRILGEEPASRGLGFRDPEPQG